MIGLRFLELVSFGLLELEKVEIFLCVTRDVVFLK